MGAWLWCPLCLGDELATRTFLPEKVPMEADRPETEYLEQHDGGDQRSVAGIDRTRLGVQQDLGHAEHGDTEDRRPTPFGWGRRLSGVAPYWGAGPSRMSRSTATSSWRSPG